MKLLIGGSPSKLFHLNEFKNALTELGIECKLVTDTDICDGFPSRKILNWFQTSKKFEKLIYNFNPDIIFVDRQRHFAHVATKYDLPLIIHLRGNIWKEIEWAKNTTYKSFPKKMVLRIWKDFANETFEKSSLILPICNYLEKITKQNYPNKKIATLQGGITSSNWYPSEGMKLKHPCVGLLQGAVIWGKTKEILVLEKVLETMPNVTFYWAGDGTYRDKILSILGKYKNFEWLGSLEYPKKVREYLTEIDVYALVSGSDMSPLTLQEAQLMKKPVVATNVGGIPELMKDNETGFLVEKGNPDEWIEKLSLLVNDKEKQKSMGELGKRFVEDNFSWKRIAKEFLEIVDNQLGIKS